MFGLSKEEKATKLNSQMLKEFNEILVNANNISTVTGRSSSLSGGYDDADTLHNIYVDFGYPLTLGFDNFWNMYRRFGPATAVVDIPPNLSWLMPPTIKANESLVKEFRLLVKKTNLWTRLKGLDKRQRVGRYAGLFFEIGDGKEPSEPVEKLNGLAQIHNLKPIYEKQLRVKTTQDDIKKPGYGEPSMYEFVSSGDGQRNVDENKTFEIHPSRIKIAAEGADDGSIFGISALENIYNDLLDLRKIAGAGGEGFYQNTRNAPVIKADDKFKPPKQGSAAATAMEKQIDDFISKYQKKFISQGLEFIYPNISMPDPKEFAGNSWNNISAGSNIPSAIIMGQQMGVRASDKDFDLLMVVIQSRRENFLDELTKSIIDWFMEHGALQTVEYELVWEDMASASDEDKLELGRKMSETNVNSFRAGQGAVFSENEIRLVSGFESSEFEIPNENIEDDDGGEAVVESE